MAEAAAAALGRRARSVRISRGQLMLAAQANQLRQALGGSAQILTPPKVNELFHPDWMVHDRRLAKSIGFVPRFDLTEGFRDTVLWYRARKWL
jgi:nucleoside-diphosphate-sugar epimerase